MGTEAGTWASEDSAAVHGGHFNWDDAQTACPDGWRLPSAQEMAELIGFSGFDGSNTGHGTGRATWSPLGLFTEGLLFPNAGGSNGYLNGSYGDYWSGTAYSDPSRAYYVVFSSGNNRGYLYFVEKSLALSVRCVQTAS